MSKYVRLIKEVSQAGIINGLDSQAQLSTSSVCPAEASRREPFDSLVLGETKGFFVFRKSYDWLFVSQ